MIKEKAGVIFLFTLLTAVRSRIKIKNGGAIPIGTAHDRHAVVQKLKNHEVIFIGTAHDRRAIVHKL